MVVILPGDLTAFVPNPVEVEYKPGLELAPIHHQHMVGMIAVNWGQTSLPENATTTAVQVTKHLHKSCIFSRKRSKYIRSTCKRRRSNRMMIMFAVFNADTYAQLFGQREMENMHYCSNTLFEFIHMLSQLFLDGHPYKTDTSVRRTPGFNPHCLSVILL